MSTYEFLLFAHLLFVVALVGTDIGMQVLSFRAAVILDMVVKPGL
jgi:hypothetical protein